MKWTNLAILTVLLATSSGQIVDIDEELICNNPSNPHDCYPKIFQATTEWQTVKPQQEIPGGLHIRMNFETSEKEAKLLDPSEVNDHGVVLSDTQEAHEEDELVHGLSRKEMHAKIQAFRNKETTERSKASDSDLNGFQSAVDEVIGYSDDDYRLQKALDTLDDLSHDLEFGAKLTSEKVIFTSLLSIAQNSSIEKIKDKVYRIMAASLRNNPEATNNALKELSKNFVTDLLLEIPSSTDVIQKRILGVVQALVQNSHFSNQYFSPNTANSEGLIYLIGTYLKLGKESKSRFVNIFEDLGLAQDIERRSTKDADVEVSKYLQTSLASKTASSNQLKVYFSELKLLHEQNDDLKPTLEFMQWLSEEVETRKDLKKRDDYSTESKDFDTEMLRARYEVFGNPMGLRKAIADEL